MPPVVSVRAVVVHNGHLLLSVCESEASTWYVVPGGGVQRGETLEEAFKRETYEECGVSLPFGKILFIREFISARLPASPCDEDVHQIDVNVQAFMKEPLPVLRPIKPDRCQTGLVWWPLQHLRQINFYPCTLIEEFMSVSWPQFYYGVCE